MISCLLSFVSLAIAADVAPMTRAEEQHLMCSELREELLEGTEVDLVRAAGRWDCTHVADQRLADWWVGAMTVGEIPPELKLRAIRSTSVPPPPPPVAAKKAPPWVAPVVVGGVVLGVTVPAIIVGAIVFQDDGPDRVTIIDNR